MKRIPKAIYQSPDQLEARIRDRQNDAMRIVPNTPEHRAIMQEIARLRIYADAKRWFRGSREQERQA